MLTYFVINLNISNSVEQITDKAQYSNIPMNYRENTEEILLRSYKMKTQTYFVTINTIISNLTTREIN